MNTETLKDEVRQRLDHGKDALKTGVETLKSAGAVVANAGRELGVAKDLGWEQMKAEAGEIVAKAGDQLKQVVKRGYDHASAQLAGEPYTRKEKAQARKAEVKAKKAARVAPANA